MLIRKRDYLCLTYFISRAFFLGVGFSFMYRSSGKDTWICIILGFLIGNIFIIIYDKISKKLNYNLNNLFLKKSIISKFYKFLFILIYLFIILYMSVIFTNFVKVYYLFDTPIWATLLLLYSVCFYASKKTEQTLIRTSFILFPVSVTLFLLNSALLIPLTDLINFLPVLTTTSNNILTGTLVFVVLSAFPNILLLEYKTDIKAKLISYSFVCIIIFILNIFITGVLGEYLITTYSYPEYMVLRRIKFLDFIENVENFASIMWYFDSFIIITLSLNKLRKIIYRNNNDIILITLLSLMIIFSYNYFSHYFSVLTYFLENGILYFTILLLLTGPILYFILQLKKSD